MDKSPLSAQNVVAMSNYQPETGYAAIAQVEGYWHALRGDRDLPKRSEVDPRGIEQALENAFILERISTGIARMRIAGSHLNDLMGMEVRGMPLTAFFLPSARRNVADLLEEVFQAPAVCSLRLSSMAAPGRPTLAAQMVLLPLRSDLGDVSRILGCLVAVGDKGEAPRRFEIADQSIRAIGLDDGSTSAAPVSPMLSSIEANTATGFNEPQSRFKAKDGDRRPPYLRLVETKDK